MFELLRLYAPWAAVASEGSLSYFFKCREYGARQNVTSRLEYREPMFRVRVPHILCSSPWHR